MPQPTWSKLFSDSRRPRRCWSPAVRDSGSPTSSRGRCDRWKPDPRSTCSSNVPAMWRRVAHRSGSGRRDLPRLDGIPLAIELAASRMASMTATEVRDRLGDRFRLLVGSRRGLERHQTLRHAVAWSYDLLDDPEKDAAESVLGVRRRIRPRKCLRSSGSRGFGRVRSLGSVGRAGAKVVAHRR